MNDKNLIAQAKSEVLDMLENRLSAPRIYIDADWEGQPIDVLAIDRDGSGDVHIVLMYVRTRTGRNDELPDFLAESDLFEENLRKLESLHAQYKYIAAADFRQSWTDSNRGIPQSLQDQMFSPDGFGRVGFVSVATNFEGDLKAVLQIKPQRFRAFIGPIADEFVRTHQPDWEVRL